STDIGSSSANTFSIIRLIRTAVLPDPAAAETSISWPLAHIACHCSSVHVASVGFFGIIFGCLLSDQFYCLVRRQCRQFPVSLRRVRRIELTDGTVRTKLTRCVFLHFIWCNARIPIQYAIARTLVLTADKT